MIEILPSLLSADFARLGAHIAEVEKAGAKMLHFDVMDGHFVPNLTIGTPVLQSIRKVTKAHIDVHLMILNPDSYIPVFVEAGADSVSVHQEVCPHLDRTLRLIQSEGALAGVVLNPSTPVSTLDDVLDVVDFVLVMSVNPGFGGQKFLPNSLRKIRQLAERRERLGLQFKIEVDGGIGVANAADAVRAGAEWLVAGNSVFGAPDPGAALVALRETALHGLQQIA
ncbi:MAG TPA: ribulose-phosphate 3-epimerase [Bryobacteraceae bacterium]|nr:ribulose-phosphate 3-epimerase [Bryobacteraceae bacterium]